MTPAKLRSAIRQYLCGRERLVKAEFAGRGGRARPQQRRRPPAAPWTRRAHGNAAQRPCRRRAPAREPFPAPVEQRRRYDGSRRGGDPTPSGATLRLGPTRCACGGARRAVRFQCRRLEAWKRLGAAPPRASANPAPRGRPGPAGRRLAAAAAGPGGGLDPGHPARSGGSARLGPLRTAAAVRLSRR